MPKTSNLDKMRRIRTVQEWIMEDYTWKDIITSATARWEISVRQAERYYSEAYKTFKQDTDQDIASKKAYYLQRKKKLIRDMSPIHKKSPAGVRAINAVLDSMAQLEGIVVHRHEFSGPGGSPIPVEHRTVIILPANNREENQIQVTDQPGTTILLPANNREDDFSETTEG